MDSDNRFLAHDYSLLDDAQLRSAIRFAERYLHQVEEDQVALLHVYREEIAAMRHQLFDRVLKRMIAGAAPLSGEQRRRLCDMFEQRRMHVNDVTIAVRAASNGRTDRLDALTEIEAMTLLLHLERDA